MSTPDTNNIGIKLQAAGENLNTWGDPNLNNDLIVGSNLSSKWNALTINGDYTVSETNYSTSNATEVATIKLVAGTVTAAFNFTMANRPKSFQIWNASGYTATIKLSATTGFALPTGRWTRVATDGSTDVYNMGPNYIGTATSVVNSGDVANKIYVDTAIATASIPASSGTVLVSGSDTTAGYVGVKVNVAGSGAASVVASIVNPAANEVKTFTVSVGDGGLADGGLQTASFAAAVGKAYVAPVGGTITLPTPTGSRRKIELAVYGSGTTTLSGTINGTSSYVMFGDQTLTITDSDGTRGWV